MTRLLLVLLLGSFTSLSFAEKTVCQKLGSDPVITDGICPSGYIYSGLLSEYEDGTVRRGARYSESFYESIRNFGRDGEEERNKQLGESSRALGQSLIKALGDWGERRGTGAGQGFHENKAKIVESVPNAESFLKDKRFKKWAYEKKQTKKLFKKAQKGDVDAWEELMVERDKYLSDKYK
jgi:hypothetical protein